MLNVDELATPCLLIDAEVLDRNVAGMSAVLPGARLRPHVKAHKCTALAAVQYAAGHTTFTCATPREVIGMARAGLGGDLLLANETVDPARLKAMVPHATGQLHAGLVHVESMLADGRAFLLGAQPSLADVAVYNPVWFVLKRLGATPLPRWPERSRPQVYLRMMSFASSRTRTTFHWS